MVEFVPSKSPPTDEARAPGMDHAHHPFRALPDAPRFVWPDGARIAFTVTLVLDYWELEPPADATPDPRIVSPLGSFFPDWLTWSQREYGARVGIFRVLDALDRFGVTPSVALGSAAVQRYPELVDELMQRNACFMAHGSHATRRITSRMSEADERAFIAAARNAVAAAVGEAPAGWCGQDFNEFGCYPGTAGRSRISPSPPTGRMTICRTGSGHMTAGGCWHCRHSRSGTTWSACGCGGSALRCGPTASPRPSPCCTKKAAAY